MKKIINLLKTIHHCVKLGHEMELIYDPLFWIIVFLIIVGLFVAILAFPLIPDEINGINVLKFIKLLGIVIAGILLIVCLFKLVSSIKDAIMIIIRYKNAGW